MAERAASTVVHSVRAFVRIALERGRTDAANILKDAALAARQELVAI
jgi:hypothetical protein